MHVIVVCESICICFVVVNLSGTCSLLFSFIAHVHCMYVRHDDET